jgi:hypothetical protein
MEKEKRDKKDKKEKQAKAEGTKKVKKREVSKKHFRKKFWYQNCANNVCSLGLRL